MNAPTHGGRRDGAGRKRVVSDRMALGKEAFMAKMSVTAPDGDGNLKAPYGTRRRVLRELSEKHGVSESTVEACWLEYERASI